MIEIANLRKYARGEVIRLEADIIFTDMVSPYPEKTIYFEIDKEHGDMLADDSYDAFVLVPLFIAMFHKQDLHIRGNISKKLYQNVIWYVRKIFCDYSPDLSNVNFTVDGFTEPTKERGKIIGTGISCGVDSLSTIYDHFVKETDPDYRINALFYFNHDIHNYRKDSSGQMIFHKLCRKNRQATADIGLPFYSLETNLYPFNDTIVKLRKDNWVSMSYINAYSCILSLGKGVFRYYTAGGSTYNQKKIFYADYHDRDMAGFCDFYLVPLIQTERTEIIIDGCQSRRVDKLKKIVDWDITKKYLDTCYENNSDGSNCGICGKCLRTLLALEIMGKLDDYADIFDVGRYRKISFANKVQCLENYGEKPFETENVDFARENNFPMPTKRECYVLGKKVRVI